MAREHFFNIAESERIEVGKGDFWCTPGGVEHGFEAGPDGAQVIDMFAPPRAEYRLAGGAVRRLITDFCSQWRLPIPRSDG
ncbi:MAG: hypothetical protein ACR2PA_21805 [Hyphomicrobiaceae bacterium]